jgi:arginyl-tRNA synthetase
VGARSATITFFFNSLEGLPEVVVYRYLENRLARHVREFLRRTYSVELPKIVIEQPPRVQLGEYALPLAFELAKRLRKAPRRIAEEIVTGIGPIEGFEKFELAGAGYINARVKREVLASALAADDKPDAEVPEGKVLVEHTSINPNKAAHIGHLRNAILGDTFVRLLRSRGRAVDVQNYIDNTGVQVADVVVGFLHLESKTRAEIERLAEQPHFDYYCWDLYARTSQWYADDKENLEVRRETLHAIEAGGNQTASVADLISVAVLRRHLETMERLDIEYDFLPRESEILHLHFWDAAFTKLKAAGVLAYESEGKNKGCWVMRRRSANAGVQPDSEAASSLPRKTLRSDDIDDVLTAIGTQSDGPRPASAGAASAIAEEDQKVIVRSNGTVGYVGKDIAYHMWKFGLLGRDFGYREFYSYGDGHNCWISALEGAPDHPHFGDVAEIYNVIDARQAEAQNAVLEALRALGYDQQADHFTHFSYEMVALTPGCAAELGYQLSGEDKARPYIEVSGRKGFGVKADDLLNTLLASAKKEVDGRHPQLSEDQRFSIAAQIAVGALRYFMLKFTKQSVIAFDFKEALSFEGETGPYVQYAVVRATNIFRKGGFDVDEASWAGIDFRQYLSGEQGDQIWELWLAASKTSYVIEQCIATTEPAYLAKHAFQLAQLFNSFYHSHPILAETDQGRRRFLLATVAVIRRELTRVLAVLGIEIPAAM